MRRVGITIPLVGLTAIATLLALQHWSRAKEYSGPNAYGNLRHLQLEKEAWQLEEHTNEWPTVEDFYGERARGKTPNQILPPRYEEIYIINRTGEPACVYFPKTRGGFSAGTLLCIRSNTLVPLQSR